MKYLVLLAVTFTVCQAWWSGSGSGDIFNDKEFYCAIGEESFFTTIPKEKVCDGNNDCPGFRNPEGEMVYEDESIYACAKENDFISHCEEKLIEQDQVCDGTKDCDCEWTDLGEDENYYECPPDPLEGQHICNADTIIPESKLCDGTVDCPADWNDLGWDENYDVCPPGDDYFVCDIDFKIDASATCDGNKDCPGEDEYPFVCEAYKELGDASTYTCWNGVHGEGNTISIEQLCDGVSDCKGFDESDKFYNDHSNNDIFGSSGDMKREIMKRHQDKMFELRGADKRHPLRRHK